MAVLLPLAGFGVVRALPSSVQAAPLPWIAPGVAALAAAVAGLALLVAVAASLEEGGVREIADAAALGAIGTAFAVVALGAAGSHGLGIGVLGAALLLLFGSLAATRSLTRHRGRGLAIVAAVVLVEAILGAILLSSRLVLDDRLGSLLLGSGALGLGIAALAGLSSAARATALGMAASSSLVMAVAGPAASERVVGATGIAVAAAILGWGIAVGRRGESDAVAPAATPGLLLDVPLAPPDPPEFDELSRIGRELRATLDDLVAARHLIGLQRSDIERATTSDSLTGLASRPVILERLGTEAAEARRYAHPLAVVLVDIDRFTEFNHQHGLELGDAVLRELALRLRVRMRQADAAGRIGADAFLMVLPHTDEAGAAAFAGAVLDRVLGHRVITDRGEAVVQLSIGIALMRPGMTFSGDELLAAAEEALASARAAGGNRIAFDRLHGLARLDERRRGREPRSVEADGIGRLRDDTR